MPTDRHPNVDADLNMMLEAICSDVGTILAETVQATSIELNVRELTTVLAPSLTRIFERAFPAIDASESRVSDDLAKLIEDKVKLEVEPLRQHIKNLEAELRITKRENQKEKQDRLEAEDQVKRLIDNIIRDLREFATPTMSTLGTYYSHTVEYDLEANNYVMARAILTFLRDLLQAVAFAGTDFAYNVTRYEERFPRSVHDALAPSSHAEKDFPAFYQCLKEWRDKETAEDTGASAISEGEAWYYAVHEQFFVDVRQDYVKDFFQEIFLSSTKEEQRLTASLNVANPSQREHLQERIADIRTEARRAYHMGELLSEGNEEALRLVTHPSELRSLGNTYAYPIDMKAERLRPQFQEYLRNNDELTTAEKEVRNLKSI
ncbi:hypothetical protein ACEPAI_4262 [Sanghuangporus weigelae]